jgi:FAD/FMN-containing dehydrogenase
MPRSNRLIDAVRLAAARATPLRIRGGGTKDFLGQSLQGEVLDTTALNRHRRLRAQRAGGHGACRHAAGRA